MKIRKISLIKIAAISFLALLGLVLVIPLSASAASTSPHWSHINILDFGRNVKYISDAALRNSTYDWFTSHVDVAEAPSNVALDYQKLNPTLKAFVYSLDFTCMQTSCPAVGTDGITENSYLHFSDNTQLNFYDLSGNLVSSASITGCPTGQPITAACRLQNYIWSSSRFVFNVSDSGYQTFMGDNLLAQVQQPGISGVFLDEHSFGFIRQVPFNGQTKIVSGGTIREYGLKATDAALDPSYNASMVNALSAFRTKLKTAGKFILVNTAGYALNPLAVDLAVAGGGVTTELLYMPNIGTADFRSLIGMVKKVTDAGGIVDLYGNPCYDGPNFTGGYYPSRRARTHMWRLAGYYILKEQVGGNGIAYLNTSMCVDMTKGIDSAEWSKAYEYNVGQPQAASYEITASGTPSCGGNTVFARDYSNALVLLRPNNCGTYDDTTFVTVTLPQAMRRLNEDGTVDPASVTQVQIRNADAVIMVKSSSGGDTPPPPSDGGNTPTSNNSGGDSSASGGSGCGFVREDNSNTVSKSQSNKAADIGLMIMLIITLFLLPIARRLFKAFNRPVL